MYAGEKLKKPPKDENNKTVFSVVSQICFYCIMVVAVPSLLDIFFQNKSSGLELE